MIKSKGTILIGNKNIRGELRCQDDRAAFYNVKNEEVLAIEYSHIRALKNVRNGGMASTITMKLADENQYELMLNTGVKVFNHMYAAWPGKPTQKSRADELHRLAELRGEKIQKPKKHLIKRRHPNRSIGGDIGVYLLLTIVAVAMGFPLVFAIGSALKPLDELFRFPPTIWPQHLYAAAQEEL